MPINIEKVRELMAYENLLGHFFLHPEQYQRWVKIKKVKVPRRCDNCYQTIYKGEFCLKIGGYDYCFSTRCKRRMFQRLYEGLKSWDKYVTFLKADISRKRKVILAHNQKIRVLESFEDRNRKGYRIL